MIVAKFIRTKISEIFVSHDWLNGHNVDCGTYRVIWKCYMGQASIYNLALNYDMYAPNHPPTPNMN